MYEPTMRKVLFVDDDQDDLEFYGDILKEVYADLAIEEAHSGQQALNLLQQALTCNSLPDLIILDMNMPLLSGLETVREIKKDPRFGAIPIVLFSSAPEIKENDQLESLGVKYFSKPRSIEEMKAVATKLLNHRA
jgi:CheY-like chemotaxis protein